ncbi:hypothetical protein ACO22_03930 [Paracoccidioides brasiliensis]|uniref:histidine kinase n=1 Tax=Paracoccidioides brasiliensis TaxID=121759 RepID=A0A1D2JEI3_PARBR|nr:hypothetical protein ACO22_03930 [Paracoccidioides brasiliensis]
MRTPPLPSPVNVPPSPSLASANLNHHRLPAKSHPAASNPGPISVTDQDKLMSSMHQYVFSGGDSSVKSSLAGSSLPKHGPVSPLSSQASRHGRPGLPPRGQRQSMHTLEELRKSMEATFIYHSRSGSHFYPPSSRPDMKLSRKAMKGFSSTPSSPSGAPIPLGSLTDSLKSSVYIDSSSSSRTIRPSKNVDPSELSAYPFPTPSSYISSSIDGSIDDGRPIAKHFSKSSAKSRKSKASSTTNTPTGLSGSSGKDHFLPPDADPILGDPKYPNPNLYDLSLMLNSEPGLDAWWSNVVKALHTHFGAERASLAVPGDSTDLENVPWKQKATFNLFRYRNSPPKGPIPSRDPDTPLKEDASSRGANEPDKRQKEGDSSKPSSQAPATSAKRPSLTARHSFAGFWEHRNVDIRDKPVPLDRPVRMESSVDWASIHPGIKVHRDSAPSRDRVPGPPSDDQPTQRGPLQPVANQIESTPCPSAVVFSVPRPLEVESDPLINRTDVVKLFGHTKPAVLTRQYSHDPMASPLHDSVTAQAARDDFIQPTPGATVLNEPTGYNISVNLASLCSASCRSTTTQTMTELRRPFQSISSCSESYEEREQIPQSPWSQSPVPSPAPLEHPEQNPFFAGGKVDQEALTTNPPSHDYFKNQPVEAIGVDRSKTVIHIPLIHLSKQATSSNTLKFPVAIISILTPNIPYPANLRNSLVYLLPHLTTSFSLAQQYSQLERQLSSSRTQRFGHILGLGGTFSDTSSEIELVAELSSHVNYTMGEYVPLHSHSTISSPIQQSNMSRPESSLSMTGNPSLEFGSNFQTPSFMPKNSTETSDSYFNVNQMSGLTNQQRLRQPNPIRKPSASMTWSPLPSKDKSTEFDELASSDLGLALSTSSRAPSTITTPQGFSRYPSSASIATQLHRELLSRPIPDTISQLILNSIPLHLFLARPRTGEVIWTNDKFDLYRRSQPQEQRAKDPWLDVHESERENLLNKWAQALRSGSQFTERVRVKRYNDESAYRWFIFRANPLLSQTGELLYWIGSFLDIHEQHMAEMKAAQEREMFATDAKYKALANSIPQVVFEASEYRGLISTNEQWQLYTGQSLDDALNLGFAKHIHPNDLERYGILLSPGTIPERDNPTESSCNINPSQSPKASNENPESGSSGSATESTPSSRSNSLRDENGGRTKYPGLTLALEELVEKGVVTMQKDENGRVSYTTEIRFQSKGGDFRWHLVRLVKVETTNFGDGGASWYGTCTDINDQKLLERKLNKEMESRTNFFSNMSHEIRTPLNGILGAIPHILDTQLDSDQRRMLDIIHNSSNNLSELVDNILDVSRVEAGKMNIVRQVFNVRSVLEEVIDTIGSRAMDKGLELNYLVESNVPKMVFGDRFRIRQILLNLMGNSVKFTSHGEILTRCSIHHDSNASLNGSEILLNFEVVDTGRGFSKADAKRLMQRFSQIEGNGSQQHTGSGLGLFLSRQLVEMHGGQLTPTSKEGQGSKFSFFVKVDEVSSRPPTPQELFKGSNAALCMQVTEERSAPKSPFSHEFLFSPDTMDLRPSSNLDVLNKQISCSPMSNPDTPNSTFRGTTPLETSQPVETGLLGISPLPATETEINVANAYPQESTPVHSSSYNVLLICPFDFAREAIRKHIEQVIPFDVTCNITSILHVEDLKNMVGRGDCPNFTHWVIDLSDINDVKETMKLVLQFNSNALTTPAASPTLIIVSDISQKREMREEYEKFLALGGNMFIVPKPIKLSSLSRIFDPSDQRELNKDRNQDTVREMNNSFKMMSKIVKEVVGDKGYRVLLVEDDETNRTVMLKYLEKVKLVSETASNGQECVDMVFSKEPGYYSLIICDIQMPIKNGYETCQEIRSWEQRNHFPQIPIMALSANAMTDQIDSASRAGFNDYVTKPIKHNELGKMLMELLDPSVPHVLLRDQNKLRRGSTSAVEAAVSKP